MVLVLDRAFRFQPTHSFGAAAVATFTFKIERAATQPLLEPLPELDTSSSKRRLRK